MDNLDIYFMHIKMLASAYEQKARSEQEPRKAYLIGQATGLLESLKTFNDYRNMRPIEDSDIPSVRSDGPVVGYGGGY